VGAKTNTGSNSVDATNVSNLFTGVNFSDNASVWYEGCYTGNTGPDGNLADATSQTTGGLTTYAPTGTTGYTNSSGVYSRQLSSTYYTANYTE
jgi:hypothetical protein